MQIRVVKEFLVRLKIPAFSASDCSCSFVRSASSWFLPFAIAPSSCLCSSRGSEPSQQPQSPGAEVGRPYRQPGRKRRQHHSKDLDRLSQVASLVFAAALQYEPEREPRLLRLTHSRSAEPEPELRPARRYPGPPQELGRHGPPPFPGSQPHSWHLPAARHAVVEYQR